MTKLSKLQGTKPWNEDEGIHLIGYRSLEEIWVFIDNI